jgi:hypothetical protein
MFSVSYKLVSIFCFIAPMNFDAINTLYKVVGNSLDRRTAYFDHCRNISRVAENSAVV